MHRTGGRAASTFALGLLLASSPALAQPTASTAIGDLRVDTLRSRAVGARALRVLLPDGYGAPENAGRRYPVLYLLDGQNLFDLATTTFNPAEWRADETVARLTRAGRIPPLIVVGIDHAGRRGRAREYLPWPDAYLDPPEPRPRGARHPAFLVDEVVPFVERRYRARRGGAYRALGGSSYGALAALYAALARPGVFGALLLESPSLYVADGAIFPRLDAARRLPARVWVGAGTNEMGRASCAPSDDGGEAVADARRLERALRARGLDDAALRVAVAPCARHHEDAWAARLPEALEFLYGTAAVVPRAGGSR